MKPRILARAVRIDLAISGVNLAMNSVSCRSACRVGIRSPRHLGLLMIQLYRAVNNLPCRMAVEGRLCNSRRRRGQRYLVDCTNCFGSAAIAGRLFETCHQALILRRPRRLLTRMGAKWNGSSPVPILPPLGAG